MMNLLAICLVLTSLLSSSVWSPSPPRINGDQEEVIVKNGHRVVVVQYDQERQHPNTKVSISPIDHNHDVSETHQGKVSYAFETAKDKIKEASASASASVLPKELICDAFGKCKHKVAATMGKTKEVVSDKTHEAISKRRKTLYEVGGAMEEAYDRAKDTVSHKARDVGEAVHQAYDKAKETVSDKAQKTEHLARETVKNAKDDVARNVSVGIEEAKRFSENAGDRVRDGAERIKTENKKGMSRIYRGTPNLGFGKLMNLGGVLDLVGLATAFGMCMWVTFISSYVLANALPRQQFGVVQSKIYPVYFKATAWSIGLALLGHLMTRRGKLFTCKREMFQAFCLLASLFMDLANLLYLEPRATKVMFERMKLEKEEGRGIQELKAERGRTTTTMQQPIAGSATPVTTTTTTKDGAAPSASSPQGGVNTEVGSKFMKLNKRLKKLNTCSSILNILTLMALSCHLVDFGQRSFVY